MIFVSSCLVGINCKYSGGNNYNQKVFDLVKEGKAIPICPDEERVHLHIEVIEENENINEE